MLDLQDHTPITRAKLRDPLEVMFFQIPESDNSSLVLEEGAHVPLLFLTELQATY